MIKKKQTLLVEGAAVLVVAGALVLGPVLNNYFTNDNTRTNHKDATMSKDTNGSLVKKDSSDYTTYAALKGDEYDRRFIADMITHHQGAVEMAKLALERADREEIKTMARAIISAQTKEITEMESWQQQWDYGNNTICQDDVNHGSMGMSDHMSMTTDELQTKTGSDFDKEFLAQMIMHHQRAINMAAPGEANAKHQEVKDLTHDVIAAQTRKLSR